eukprot:gene15884-17484_t
MDMEVLLRYRHGNMTFSYIDSNFFACNMVRQHKFLTMMLDQLSKEPQKVIDDLEQLRSILTHPSSIQMFIAVDAAKLHADAHKILSERFLPHDIKSQATQRRFSVKSDHELVSSKLASKIVGIGAVESAFLYQSAPCIDSFTHHDYPALLVLIEYLCALEGPLWRQIRGLGLSYHYSISVDPSSGKLTFILMKSTHIFSAYQKGKQIVDDFISGKTPFEEEQLEAAVSGVIFQTIEKEQTIGDAAHQSMLSVFKGIEQSFCRDLLAKVSSVTIDDLTRVAKTYFTRLFDPTVSCAALCCHPSKVDEIVKDFKGISMDLQVVTSLDDEFNL